MKKSFKNKIISYLVVVTLMVSMIPVSNTKAENEEVSSSITGQCGENAYFELSEDGVLRITGEGEIDTKTYTDLTEADVDYDVKKIIMADTITSIGEDAFASYFVLEEVEFSDNITTIGKYAFRFCTNLTSIEIPNGVTSIESAFEYCSKLETVKMLGGVSNIDYAFRGCTNLKEIELPYGVASMEYTFMSCSNLTNINIPNSVTNIEYAFSGCTGITEIEIPNSVTNMFRAFANCSNITKITIKNPEMALDEYNMPDNLETIYGYKGSTAENYANDNGISFVALDAEEESETTTEETINTEEIDDWVMLSGRSKSGARAYISGSISKNLGSNLLRGFYDAGTTTGWNITEEFNELDVFGIVVSGGHISGVTIDGVAYFNNDEFVLYAADCIYINQELLEVDADEIKYFNIIVEGSNIGNQGQFVLKVAGADVGPETLDKDIISNTIIPADSGWKKVSNNYGTIDDLHYYVPKKNTPITTLCELKNKGNMIGFINGDSCTVTGPAYGFSISDTVGGVWINGVELVDGKEVYIYKDIIVIAQSVFTLNDQLEKIFYITVLDEEGNDYTYPLKVTAEELIIPEEETTTANYVIADGYSYIITQTKYALIPSSTIVDGVTYKDLVHETGVKISSGKYVTVPECAIDYMCDSAWMAYDNGVPVELIIDLGKSRNIKQINISWYNVKAEIYAIELSDDNEKYKEVARVADSTALEYRIDKIILDETVSSRYVKINCITSHDGMYSIYDMAVYGTETEETTTVKDIEEETPTNNETTKKTADNNIDDKIELCKTKIVSIAEKNYKSAKITWNKVDGASFYEVYRAKKKKGKYKLIATLGANKYIDKTVKAGKKYFYKVKAISADGENTLSNIKKIKIKGTPNRPSIRLMQTKDTWSIVWGTIKDNSKGIEIYMKTGSGMYKKYTLINTTTKLKKSKKKKGVTGISSSIDTLQSGYTYQFKARTYAIVNGEKVYSKWSKVMKLER